MELRLDYEDFLRTRRLPLESEDSPIVSAVRRLAHVPERSLETYREFLDGPPGLAANALITLTWQATFLLQRQLERLQQDFVEQGGIQERMYRARTRSRE